MSETPDSSRPTAEEVAKRAIILRFVTTPAFVEPPPHVVRELLAAKSLSDEEGLDFLAFDLNERAWATLGQSGIESGVSNTELELLKTNAVSRTAEQYTNALWRIESYQVILWALGKIEELPAYDSRASHEILQIPIPSPEEFIAQAQLIDQKTIDKARDIAEMWHWRSRSRWLLKSGQLGFFKSQAVKTSIRKLAQIAFKDGEIPPPINDDLPANGKAYRDLTDDEWSEVRSITMERHFALNWLCGYAPGNDWDQTPTDT